MYKDNEPYSHMMIPGRVSMYMVCIFQRYVYKTRIVDVCGQCHIILMLFKSRSISVSPPGNDYNQRFCVLITQCSSNVGFLPLSIKYRNIHRNAIAYKTWHGRHLESDTCRIHIEPGRVACWLTSTEPSDFTCRLSMNTSIHQHCIILEISESTHTPPPHTHTYTFPQLVTTAALTRLLRSQHHHAPTTATATLQRRIGGLD